MKSTLRFVWYWGPVIGWMSLIFYLSSRQSISVSETLAYDFLLFKSLHMIEYAFMYLLVFRAINTIQYKGFTFRNKLVVSFAITLLYAISDELHQTFVPTRTGRARDLFVDTLGIFLMYSYIKSHKNFIKLLI